MEVIISVIMPIYNAEKYLVKAVKSVLEQTFKNFELILVDDGSIDDSPKICDDFSSQDKRVRVIHQENGGICKARNKGIDVANGSYIMFIDNDDEIEENTLKDNYELLIKNKADWVKFGKREILYSGEKSVKNESTNFKRGSYDHKEIINNLLRFRAEGMMTFLWDSIISKELVDKNNIRLDEKFKSGNEDIDFCEEYAAYARKLVVNDKCYYNHYTRMGISASSKFSNEKIMSYKYLLEKSNKRYENYGIQYQNDINYQYIVSKQIVLNVCQKLNDAGELITKDEKLQILKKLKEAKCMNIYNQMKAYKLLKKSKKLFIYNILYKSNKNEMLLMVDKYSRKIMYRIRNGVIK